MKNKRLLISRRMMDPIKPTNPSTHPRRNRCLLTVPPE